MSPEPCAPCAKRVVVEDSEGQLHTFRTWAQANRWADATLQAGSFLVYEEGKKGEKTGCC